MLLTAMIFASNADVHSRIQRRCINGGDINLFRSPDYRPSLADMMRMINSYSPEIVFIELHDKDDALELITDLRAHYSSLTIVGVSDEWQHDRLFKTDAGYVRVIPSTIPPEQFNEVVTGAVEAMRIPGPDNVIVFVPSKAGSGASTVALNVAGSLANRCGKSVILIEADLHSGPAGMYLNLNPVHSVVDALEDSHRLEAGWNELVTPVQNFCVLPACNIKGPIPQASSWAYRRLISFTRRRYEHVIFDLPEIINPATEVIVSSAHSVFVVCTPEVPSLMMARKRCAALIDRGVVPDRLKIILNRYSKDGPDTAAIAGILGHSIVQTIPNDYQSLWEANLKRRLVADGSTVGRSFEQFARRICGSEDAAGKSRKILGLFPAA